MKQPRPSARPQPAVAGIVGTCPALLRVLNEIELVAPTSLPVLVLGESGVGKERIARYVHERSRRAAGPFVVVNCGAVPKDLAESILFGFERGSFTGAVSTQKGKFELADGGTIFLDEVGELPVDQQVKLLRVLQDGVIERIGGAPRSLDVRVVAATSRNVWAMMSAGTFREDLYYRISGLEVVVPPLRERGGDIGTLADAFLERAATVHGTPRRRLSADATAFLRRYPWPGNIRQLERAIETAAVIAGDKRITAADLRARVHHPDGEHATVVPARDDADVALMILRRDGRLTAGALRTEVGRSAAHVRRVLARLVQSGVIHAVGTGGGRYYVTR